MPPEVAQAPIVIRNFELALISLISSMCAGVEIDPSTRVTSYGPGSSSLASMAWNSTRSATPAASARR